MKRLKLFCLIIALLGLIPASSVWARGGHHFGGFGGYGGYGYRGYGYGYPGYGYGYPGYGYGYRGGYGGSYPPVIYIEQQGNTRATIKPQTNYWHYCSNPEGYYPHIKKCPGGWMQVVPQLSPPQ